MDILNLAACSKEEKVAILNNPQLLTSAGRRETQITQENISSGYNQSDANIGWNRLIGLVAKALSENQLSLAEEIVELIPDRSNDLKAWKLYYQGYLAMVNENSTLAEQQFSLSLKAKPISWCYYYLADLYIKKDPIVCYEYFALSLKTDPMLSEEPKSRAINWMNSFFNQEMYLRLNADLKSPEINSDIEHYKKYGFKEGRLAGVASVRNALESMALSLPREFKWDYYLNNNLDLRVLIAEEQSTLLEAEYLLTKHYIDHGKAENRPYSLKAEENHEHASESLYQFQKDYIGRKARLELSHFLNSSEKIKIGKSGIPIITIIMIVYNKAEYTLQAIESIKASKQQSVSLIVVDNNSTDSTQKLLARLTGDVTIISNDFNSHFLRSVNQALPYVKSPYFCLLNNDAFLDRTTLDESIACLERYSNSAIVGGLVLHADGYIQDAGSIVFSDGSCRGLGRRMTPSHHLFNFERSVDFVSGAYLATTLSVMQRLGGFDEKYSPAYYEETDLCFRAHDLGIPVIYSPAIVIRHVEYGSSSTSEQAIALMAKNKSIFCDSHITRLKGQLRPSSYIQDDIMCLMHGHLKSGAKVLYIDDRIPQSDLGSGFGRAVDIIQGLKELAAFVTVYATDYKRSIASSTFLPYGVECIESDRENLLMLINTRHDFYDYIFTSREHNQRLLLQIIHELEEKGLTIAAKLIFDAESLFSIRNHAHTYLQKYGSVLENLSNLDLGSIAAEELERFTKADIITSVSNFEYNLIAKTFPQKKTFLLGIPCPDIEEYSFSLENRDCVTFLGAIHEEVSPNHDSLIWMRDEILPSLETFPIFPSGLKIVIAGNVSCASTLKLLAEITSRFGFVKFLGLVDDLPGLFSRTRVFIAPTRYAAGVPHKVYLASSFGVPSITTSIVAEQMGWSSNKAVLVANHGLEFARMIASCYEDFSLFDEARVRMASAFKRDCSHAVFTESLKKIIGL